VGSSLECFIRNIVFKDSAAKRIGNKTSVQKTTTTTSPMHSKIPQRFAGRGQRHLRHWHLGGCPQNRKGAGSLVEGWGGVSSSSQELVIKYTYNQQQPTDKIAETGGHHWQVYIRDNLVDHWAPNEYVFLQIFSSLTVLGLTTLKELVVDDAEPRTYTILINPCPPVEKRQIEQF